MATQFEQMYKTIQCGDQVIYMTDFTALKESYNLDRLPYSIKILLENVLRHASESFFNEEDVYKLVKWDVHSDTTHEISFVPARVILQDFTGVPAIVDLAAMRNAMNRLGGDTTKINPFNPVELVIDHSVMVDYFASEEALEKNTALEVERNKERYEFLKWGQSAFSNFKVVPPGGGIVHQINLEHLARCVFKTENAGQIWAYPDTLVGTDSHTTMINGLGILGWGVGGIEAEAAMLGQPITMLIPKVVGFKLVGKLNSGVTATDLVLTITEKLRKHGVVGKFVEFYGPSLNLLSAADRATIANMAPEYGATCGIFPLDQESCNYLSLTGRTEEHIQLVKTYAKQLGIWNDSTTPAAEYHELIEFDLSVVEPCIAGPKRPQDRINLSMAAQNFNQWLDERLATSKNKIPVSTDANNTQSSETNNHKVYYKNTSFELEHGSVVIAAITSCTNTSNPAILVAAGLLARNAIKKGLKTKPWVKTSLAPGSQVVTEYLTKAGLMSDLAELGFNLVGYGCTTCIGNSGPLPEPIEDAIRTHNINVCSVLSGNRNFEGRIHPEVAANYLASPPLVVAYALAGNLNVNLAKDPLGYDLDNKAVYLSDIWPKDQEIKKYTHEYVSQDLFKAKYANIFDGSTVWNKLTVSDQVIYDWPDSSYIKEPPFFTAMQVDVSEVEVIQNARCLVKVGDSITTDHISPAGSIAPNSPAGLYLKSLGIDYKDFNSYGSRRGNHEVMMRGTFANVRLKNQLAPGTEGSWTCYHPTGEVLSIFDAALRYKQSNTATVILAGKEYGTGSSRDWAAKGPALLGVRAVLAESYERIHRSNLIGMGILPLQFKENYNHTLTGNEFYSIPKISPSQKEVIVTVFDPETKKETCIDMLVRIDTDNEYKYLINGGILPFVIRNLLK